MCLDSDEKILLNDKFRSQTESPTSKRNLAKYHGVGHVPAP
jgi:hypothetical protein